MKLLLDTHVLVWAALGTKLSPDARAMISDVGTTPVFSVVSLWELAIKASLRRADFSVDPGLLRRGMLDAGYEEIAISAEHALAVRDLPPIHSDPFDRLLVATAR